MSKFCANVFQMRISQQPLIRKHSYLGHGYLGGGGGGREGGGGAVSPYIP